MFQRPTRHLIVIATLLFLGSTALATPADDESRNSPTELTRSVLLQLDDARQTVVRQTNELVGAALGLIGVPYRRGGSSSETGFDCSGFVRTIYQDTIGLILPRKAEQQAAATQRIDKSDLQPGDLVFFNTMRRAFSHVGIYIGDGKFVHAPRAGAKVRVESLDLGYWKHRFDGARRVAAPALSVELLSNAFFSPESPDTSQRTK